MKFISTSAFVLSLVAIVHAAPTPTVPAPPANLGVFELLTGICDKIGGTMLTQTVCQTATGSDISVSAANGGLAKVTVSGKGLLSGASITVPVGSLESVLGQLGLVSVFNECEIQRLTGCFRVSAPLMPASAFVLFVDLGGAGASLKREELADRAVSVDFRGSALNLKREDLADRAVSVDFRGSALNLKREDLADRAVAVDIGGAGLTV